MLQLFKSGRAESYILLLIIGVLAWIPAFNQSSFIEVPAKLMPGYSLLVYLLLPFKYISVLLGLIAAIGGAFVVND